MTATFDLIAFLLGCGGALAHEALRWIGFRFDARLPTYLRKLHYWLLTIVLVVLGGGLASILGPTSAAQALCFGIAAPAILSRLGTLASDDSTLAGPTPVALPGRSLSATSLRDFLRG
jgi:hypothetical protein